MKTYKPQTDTIVRTIVLFITLINQVLIMTGINPLPFAEDEIYTFISAVAGVIAAIWAWWKNNSFTPKAIDADEYLDVLRYHEDENNGDS